MVSIAIKGWSMPVVAACQVGLSLEEKHRNILKYWASE